MKRKNLVSLLCLILTMISLMTSVVWAGVAGFEVSNGTGSTAGSGSGSTDWFISDGKGVITRSGTRYAIRVQNESGEYEDIGGDYYDLFWLNHLYNAYQNSNSDNDTGKAKESMWSGSSYYYKNAGLDSTVKYPVRGMYKLDSGKKVFDTNASSLSTYTKSVKNSSGETVEQARHVLTWILNKSRTNGTTKNMTIHTDGFGLNDDDIKKLINFEKKVAEFWLEDNNKGSNDKIREACQKVLEQIEQIKAGKLNIQIRSEILLRPRPAEDLKNKSVRGIDVSVRLRTIKDSSQYYYYLTFRECLALDKEGVISNDNIVKTAKLLRETNEPWRSEAKYVAEAKKYGSNYWLGWDYIQFENPYQLDQTTITINYKDEKTGKDICPSEMVEPGEHSKKDFKGYEYTGLEIVKPNPEEKDSNKTSITITDDKETHEITFWYKPEEVTRIKVIHKSKGGQTLQEAQNYIIEDGGSAQTFSQIASSFGSGWNYVGVDVTCDDNTLKDQATDPSVTISYNGSVSYEITFWYAMQTQVKIMGRCEGMSKPIYTEDVGTLDLPLNKTFKEKDYTPSKAYKFLDEYEVKEGTFAWTSKGSTETGNSVTLNLDEVTTTPQQILIVFYYESKYTLTVNHIYVDPITGDEKVEKTFSNLQIIPGEEKSLSSISMSNYLNLKYEPSSEVTADGFTKYSKSQNNVYTLKFTPSEKNYTINFYYTSQTITVKHIQNNEVKKEETKVLDPNHGEEALREHPFQKWVLNETEIGTETPKKVSIKEGVASQELIFYYQEPNLIFGPEDPNDYKEYPDGKTYTDMVNDYQTGIIPSDLNNQTINQKDTEYYWVLNQNCGLLIRFANTHLEDGSGNCSFVATIKIPFDVYVGGVLKSANTELTVTCQYKQTSNGYDIYTGALENIYVPIWVTEGDYEIAGTVVSTYTSNDGAVKATTSNASVTVKVVGAVYDFTITNLDGSDTTGDTMWKKALFGTAKEYKATETAVGQGTQQAKNYNYGIKRGTRFYFSLNTIGQKNKKIEIVPTFYYIDANGKKENVTMKSNYLTNTRSISLTDTNRTTTEFKNERAKKTGKTNATTFAIGDYTKVTLDGNVNTPYLGITNELLVKQVKTGVTLSDYANHWYGDYAVPNDAKFYKADGTLVSDENGVVVVHFEIKTIDDKNAYYLAYDGDSPFVQTQKTSQWNYERQNKNLSATFNNAMTMPKVSTAAAKTASEVWKINNSTATIIYSLRANATTKQNVTSIGTH